MYLSPSPSMRQFGIPITIPNPDPNPGYQSRSYLSPSQLGFPIHTSARVNSGSRFLYRIPILIAKFPKSLYRIPRFPDPNTESRFPLPDLARFPELLYRIHPVAQSYPEPVPNPDCPLDLLKWLLILVIQIPFPLFSMAATTSCGIII